MFTFGIVDVIDIVLVATLLFYLYQLMKESRSAAIFSGVLVFVVAWIFVSQVFEMKLLGGILDKVMNMGALVLIILFQEEIRHFFSSIGTRQRTLGRLLRMLSRRGEGEGEQTHRENIIPIVMACMNMGRGHVGALIVIERAVGLSEVIRSGELINANISQRLIENIFFKNSPLHDGAMVVSHKRLRAAGCILPVSHASDIPKSLGLRHRAALGISTQSDCIAIVVSEETGAISVAMNGNFRLRLSPEELETLLNQEWTQG